MMDSSKHRNASFAVLLVVGAATIDYKRLCALQVIACDYTYRVLTVAQQENAGRTPLVCADAEQLPFADG